MRGRRGSGKRDDRLSFHQRGVTGPRSFLAQFGQQLGERSRARQAWLVTTGSEQPQHWEGTGQFRRLDQYRDKSDVWSESAGLLYEEAVQRQWSSAVDIPWQEIPELPNDLEMAMCTLCTFLTQVEFIAGDLPGRFMHQIPAEHFEAQLFLGTQVMDEARHEDVFRKRALVNGGGLVDSGLGASQLLTADDFTEMTARLHLVGEGFAQTIFRMGELIATNDAEKRIFRLSAQDESRHLAFGIRRHAYQVPVGR